MTSYLITCPLYQKKIFRFKVFQCKISDQMSYLGTLYANFENFRKMKFQWERIFIQPHLFYESSSNFQSENAFDLTNKMNIKMRGLQQCIKNCSRCVSQTNKKWKIFQKLKKYIL